MWTMPTEFPDLSAARGIAIDIETRDPDLQSKGPGVRRNGYIVGIGIVTDDKEFKAYYPIAHDEGPNMNKTAVLSWLNNELSRNQPKIGANLLYDIDYLTAAGVTVNGNWLDVQNAEPLINENVRRYNLDALALKYLDKQKLSSILVDACKERGFKGKPHQHIWQLPAAIVGPYCIADAELCIDIFNKQLPILRDEGLEPLFRIETYLMPMLLHMRQTGVRLDTKSLAKAIKGFKARLRKNMVELSQMVGFQVEPWTGAALAIACDKLDIKYPLTTTKTRKPSFTKEFMTAHEHPFLRMVAEVRRLHKFIGTFLEGQMQSQLINGRIHCQFNQLRGDEYGTVTGRFSSSHPNLQFIPARDKELGPLCRSMFIPEEDCDWIKADYSQIEYRIFSHYAIGQGADDFRDTYNSSPDIDYHQWCANAAGISRKNAKTINFGLLYGMGVKLLAQNLNLPVDEAKDFLAIYHGKVPFLRTTFRRAMETANQRGYVKTILNRRRRFPLWIPADRQLASETEGHTNPELVKSWVKKRLLSAGKEHSFNAGIQRKGTFKALNAVIQGSSADMIKKAMVDCWRAGIFNILTPHITVHDELDVSVPKTKAGTEALQEMLIHMRDAIPLKVPVIIDCGRGPSWGETK